MSLPMVLPGVEVPPLSLRPEDTSWGIDPSTRRVALGAVVPTGPDSAPRVDWGSLTLEQYDDPMDRLSRAHAGLVEFFGNAGRLAPPAYVQVEQPFGSGKSRPHPQSYYIVAAVLLALRTAVPEAKVELVDPMTWKSTALGQGHGAAKKPEVLAFAHAAGYDGDCPRCHGVAAECPKANGEPAHDEADAIAIATSATMRRLTATG